MGDAYDSDDDVAALVQSVLGDDYDGPLSNKAEWHSLELGAYAGLAAAVPALAPIVAGRFGIDAVTGGLKPTLKRQVKAEPHYFAVGTVLSYFAAEVVTSGSVAALQVV